MDSILYTNETLDTGLVDTTEEHKVILLPVQNRHSNTTPIPVYAERIAQLLHDNGYKAQIIEKEHGSVIESSAEGWKFRVTVFYDSTSAQKDTPSSLMLSSGWGIDHDDVELISKAANTFNTKFRYLKAYVVTDDEYSFTEAEMSQFCPDGMSNNQFNAFVDMFINLRQSYVSICREVRK